MDEAITLISDGCRMAKILESNLSGIANQPDHLFASCTEIITAFTKARDNLSQAMLINLQQLQRLDPVQEWLHRSQTPAMDLLYAQHMAAPGSSTSHDILRLPGDGKMKGIVIEDGSAASGTLAEVVAPLHQRAPSGSAAAAATTSGTARGGSGSSSSQRQPRRAPSGSAAAAATTSGAARGGSGSSSSQRQRRRGDAGGGRRVEQVAAPEMGNTEIPPEDGFTWRKYGQKAILHSRFPRSYFRCTHQKLYDCPAKKQVQRQDDDPRIFQITYLGHHTCHFSSTAPSAAPPPPPPPQHHQQQLSLPPDLLHQQQTHHLDLATPAPVFISQWLSIGGTQQPSGAFVGPRNLDVAAGPSTSTAYHAEYLQAAPPQPVADMADAMFNSGGSSSNNSMDLIFSSMDRHQHSMNWDPSEKRN